MRQGCLEVMETQILHRQRWQGILDSLSVLGEAIGELSGADGVTLNRLHEHLGALRERVEAARGQPQEWAQLLQDVRAAERAGLNRQLTSLVESHGGTLDPDRLHSLQIWVERFRAHLRDRQRELNSLAPWLLFLSRPPSLAVQAGTPAETAFAWRALEDCFPPDVRLSQVSSICATAHDKLERFAASLDRVAGMPEQVEETRKWCRQLASGLLAAGETAASALD
jgi:hypothetical protein